MATVLPFDPAFRRRTPAAARAAAPRPTPLPRRAMRAVRAVEAENEARTGPVAEGVLARRFFAAAFAVALVDLAAKALAVAALPLGTLVGRGPVALMLAYNTGMAGGMSLGAHTRAINLASTGVVVGLLVMLVPALARIDRRAPARLALVVGGGLGNMASVATSPRGVADFLVLRWGPHAMIVNVADLAMLAGLLLLARTGLLLIRAIRTHGARARVLAV